MICHPCGITKTPRPGSSAILKLQYGDLRLAKTAHEPYGSIRWPSRTDKSGKEWVAPLNPQARAALDRILAERPGVGEAYVFPSSTDPSRSLPYFRARSWLLKAEELARVET